MERLLCDLKIVASQRTGDRLYQHGGALQIMHPSLLGSLFRLARGDSRSTSVAAVVACLSEALALADEYALAWKRVEGAGSIEGVRDVAARGSFGTLPEAARLHERALHLIGEIEASAAGLRHMRLTYAEDIGTCAKLGVLAERVRTQVDILKDVLGVARRTSPDLRHCNAPSGELLVLSLPDF